MFCILFINKTHLYRYLLSLIFGSIVILAFYLIRWLVPQNISMYNELVTIIFIIVSVLVLFPARKKILSRYLQADDYTSLVGDNFSDLDFAERPFSMRALVRTGFPDFIDWLRLSSGSLAILGPERKSYRVYRYRKKKLLGSYILNRKAYAKLHRFLVRKPQGVSITEKSLPEEVCAQMKSLNAHTIHPLLYRSVVMGFLVFPNTPQTVYANHALEIFKHKAALSVQNYILSHRAIDSRIYDQEFKIAQRVQKALENTTEPEITGYKIKRLTTGFPFVFEFFKVDQKRWIFTALLYERFTGPTGILIYSILGQLHSLIHLQEYFTLSHLADMIKDNQDWQRTKYPIRILFIELNEGSKRLRLFTAEEDFHVGKIQKNLPLKLRAIQDKIVHLQLDAQTDFQMLYQNVPFLNISYNKNMRLKAKPDVPIAVAQGQKGTPFQ